MRYPKCTALTAVLLALACSACLATNPPQVAPARPSVSWVSWSDDLFAQAKREHRFVLLDLEAVWCHWCHVMDETTYKDPRVVRLLELKYVTVKVDQDSRPDLSNRYEDYGWPATVVFAEDGSEIVKRQGYLSPDEMASMLQAIIDDPTPGPSVKAETKIDYATNPLLPAAERAALGRDFLVQYDKEKGGWGFADKFVDEDSAELSLIRARAGDRGAARMLNQTLDLEWQLIDPVWGGAYQYSAGGDWNQPHFEKIASIQASTMRIYARAYAQWHDPKYLQAAENIHRFVIGFLMSPEGTFYVSQDADLVEGQHSAKYFALGDAERRKLGVPRMDTHIYARENGWIIDSLASLYAATGEEKYLDEALRAADWIVANRALPGGGFRHDGVDAAGPYLGDSLAMARALESLYAATADRRWLQKSQAAMNFIAKNFTNAKVPGFLTAETPQNASYRPHPAREENILLLKTAILLYHYSGENSYREMAAQAMRYLATPAIARTFPAAGVLLADYEFTHAPLHATVVGRKDDPAARMLFDALLRSTPPYRRIEWWDTREGPLPHAEIEYPALNRAAAFFCDDRTCSKPIYDVSDLQSRMAELVQQSRKAVIADKNGVRVSRPQSGRD